MAVGDLVTTDWMIERNGLVIGDGTSYDIRKISGLTAAPNVRAQDKPFLFRQGARAGDDYVVDRTFTVSIDIVEATPASMTTLIQALDEAFRPSKDEVQTVFKAPGLAGGVKAYVNARVRNRDMPQDLQFLNGLAEVDIQFHCSDGRIRSLAESTDTATLASNAGGATFPLTFPLTFGASNTADTITAVNDGSYDAPVVLKIDGPCTNPKVTNETSGKTLQLNYVVPSGSYLELDSDLRSVTLDGSAAAGTGASRYYALDTSSVWFDLVPGSNSIVYSASTDAGSVLTATWRDVSA